MMQTGTDKAVQHEQRRGERCNGCGKAGSPKTPLSYEMQDDIEGNYYPYCEACYREFRAFYEQAEDDVIAALKSHHLHERYTLPYLRAALESLGAVSDEAFASYLEKGTVSFFRQRTAEEGSAAG